MLKYNEFIKESIRLGDKGLKKYFIKSIRPYKKKRGYSIIDLVYFDDKEISLLIEIYGSKEDSQFILKVYNSSFKVDEDQFKIAIDKVLFIMNKNLLDHDFSIHKIVYPDHMNAYAIIDSNKIIDITNLEQIIASTKIINKKIKKTDDLDDMIRLTSENIDYNTEEIDLKISKYIDSIEYSIMNSTKHFLDYNFLIKDKVRIFSLETINEPDKDVRKLFNKFKDYLDDKNVNYEKRTQSIIVIRKDEFLNKLDLPEMTNMMKSIKGSDNFNL